MTWKLFTILNIVALILFFMFWTLGAFVNSGFLWGANIVFAIGVLFWIIVGVNQYSNSKK